MTATERLRELLDERGAEYEVQREGKKSEAVIWNGPIGTKHSAFVSNENPDKATGTILYATLFLTPAQAVEATLGRGTCHNAMPLLSSGMPYPDSWMCSECGGRMDGIILEVGNYCPNCGREVIG